MKGKKTLNRTKTLQNILDKCNSSIGYSVDLDKFNKRKNDDEFLIEAAKFCEVQVSYY